MLAAACAGGRQAVGRPAAEDRVERAAAAAALLAAWQSVRTSPASGRNESKRHEE